MFSLGFSLIWLSFIWFSWFPCLKKMTGKHWQGKNSRWKDLAGKDLAGKRPNGEKLAGKRPSTVKAPSFIVPYVMEGKPKVGLEQNFYEKCFWYLHGVLHIVRRWIVFKVNLIRFLVRSNVYEPFELFFYLKFHIVSYSLDWKHYNFISGASLFSCLLKIWGNNPC